MLIAESIRKLIQERGLKQEWLAEQAGMAAETLSRITTGTTANPGIETVQKIAVGAGITVGELLGETGFDLTALDRTTLRAFRSWIDRKLVPERDALAEPNAHRVSIMLVEPEQGASIHKIAGRVSRRAAIPADPEQTKLVPRRRGAADPHGQVFNDEADPPKRPVPPYYWDHGAREAYKAEGDSMIGLGITDNDLLFVRPTTNMNEANWKIVIVSIDGAEFVKVLKLDAGKIELLSANPAYQPMSLDEDSQVVRLIGVVIGRSGDVLDAKAILG